MVNEDADKRNRGNPWEQQHGHYLEKEEDVKLGGVFLVGLIGATATTLAVTRLHKTVDWVSSQLARIQSSWKGVSGGSFRTSYKEEACKRYNKRMQEEYEDEMERVERIRRMQSVFNRQRNKYKRNCESWAENGPGTYNQHFQRNDWYWKADTSYRDHKSNFRDTPRESSGYLFSHHYLVLGLDRLRTKPYTDDEIKTAFRAKAMEFHPDQNQDDKEAAEVKFKEVMMSYEAIKSERNNSK